jgi:thiol-disulfide isomerase/thioredoxin
MSSGGYVLLAVLVLSVAFGIYRKLSDGKLREEIVPPLQGLSEHLHLDHDHPPQVTFLQFSSEFCQPCRVTSKVLDEVTNSFPAICHIELDVVEHLDLVKTYGISRTPTTLIIDKSGTVHFRATGVPKKADLISAVTELVKSE